MAFAGPRRLRERQVSAVLYDRAAKTTKDLLPNFDNWVDEFAWGPADSIEIYFVAGSNRRDLPIYRDERSLTGIDLKPSLAKELENTATFIPLPDREALSSQRE